MDETEYNTVKDAIRTASDVSAIEELYEKAMTGRLTVDEYNLMAEKSDAKDSIDAYVAELQIDLADKKWKESDGDDWFKDDPWYKDYNKNVTMDDAVVAKLDEVVTTAKESIDAVTVAQNKVATTKVSKVLENQKNAILEVFKFAVEKQARIEALDNVYNTQLTALKAVFTEDDEQDDLEVAIAELDQLLQDGKDACALTTTAEELEEAMKVQYTMKDYVELVKAKHDAKKALDTKYTGYIESNTAKSGSKGTEEEYIYSVQLKQALENGKAAIDAATKAGTEANEKGTVAGIKEEYTKETTGILPKIDALNTAANTTVTKLKTYATSATPLPDDTSKKYTDGIAENLNSVIAKDAISVCTTTEEITAYEKTANGTLHKAMKTYLVSLLNKYYNLTGSKNDDKVMTYATYKDYNESLTTLNTEVDYSKADFSTLTIAKLIEDFNGNGKMVELDTLENVKNEMDKAFKDEIKWSTVFEVKRAENGAQETDKYSTLPTVVETMNKASFSSNNSIASAKDYDGIVSKAKVDLLNALIKDLTDILTSKGINGDKYLAVERATSFEGAISAYTNSGISAAG